MGQVRLSELSQLFNTYIYTEPFYLELVISNTFEAKNASFRGFKIVIFGNFGPGLSHYKYNLKT